jgi:hypothetical protein
MFCSGSFKCAYCKGKGERPRLFSRKLKKCKRCHGTGACPFCLGDKKSWIAKRIMKWIPDNRREEFIQMRRKDAKLRERYEYLRSKNIDLMPLEEFRKNEKYTTPLKRVNIRKISTIIEVVLDLSIQMLGDYELYIGNIERNSE